MKTRAVWAGVMVLLFAITANADEVNDFCNAIKKNNAKGWLKKYKTENPEKMGQIEGKYKRLFAVDKPAMSVSNTALDKKHEKAKKLGEVSPQLAQWIKSILEKRQPAAVATGETDPLPPVKVPDPDPAPPAEIGQEVPGHNIEPGTGPDATGNSQLIPSEISGVSGGSESASKGID